MYSLLAVGNLQPGPTLSSQALEALRGFVMLKSIAGQSITAVAAAALVAGLAVFLTSVAPEAKAEPAAKAAVHVQKSDRLPLPVTGARCSSQSWPNYDHGCQFDLRQRVSDAGPVRVIALR